MNLDTIYTGDALSVLRTFPDQSINCVVTSPPYFNLRNYGVNGQLGSESTMREYIDNMLAIFCEVHRVLRDDGTLWVNLSDSRSTKQGSRSVVNYQNSTISVTAGMWAAHQARARKQVNDLPQKSLMMVPARFAIGMIDNGWILRDEIIWSKPNPMPESVQDRTTRAHEMIYMFSKCGRYWYDADPLKTPVKPQSIKRKGRAVNDDHKMINGAPGQTPHSFNRSRPNTNKQDSIGIRTHAQFNERYDGASVPMANARSVWTFSAVGTKEHHFATFPRELPRRCIVAGCPADGVVLDPFMGSGTTGLVARILNRHYIGIELNPAYVALAEQRLAQPYQPMLMVV